MISNDQGRGGDGAGGADDPASIPQNRPPSRPPGFPRNVPFRPRRLRYEPRDGEDENSIYLRALYHDPEEPDSPLFALDVEFARVGDQDDRRRIAEFVRSRLPRWAAFHLLTGDDRLPGRPVAVDVTGVKRPLGLLDVVLHPKLLTSRPGRAGAGKRVGITSDPGEDVDYVAAFAFSIVTRNEVDIWTSDNINVARTAQVEGMTGEGVLTRTDPANPIIPPKKVILGQPEKISNCITVEVRTALKFNVFEYVSLRLQKFIQIGGIPE